MVCVVLLCLFSASSGVPTGIVHRNNVIAAKTIISCAQLWLDRLYIRSACMLAWSSAVVFLSRSCELQHAFVPVRLLRCVELVCSRLPLGALVMLPKGLFFHHLFMVPILEMTSRKRL